MELSCARSEIFAAKLTHVSILQFYVGVIRPILEYAIAAWHTSLSLEMPDQLALLQKRGPRIIYGGSRFNSDSYASYCAELCIETLRVTPCYQVSSHTV